MCIGKLWKTDFASEACAVPGILSSCTSAVKNATQTYMVQMS